MGLSVCVWLCVSTYLSVYPCIDSAIYVCIHKIIYMCARASICSVCSFPYLVATPYIYIQCVCMCPTYVPVRHGSPDTVTQAPFGRAPLLRKPL